MEVSGGVECVEFRFVLIPQLQAHVEKERKVSLLVGDESRDVENTHYGVGDNYHVIVEGLKVVQ